MNCFVQHNQSAIHVASSKGYASVIKALVAGGADVNLLDDVRIFVYIVIFNLL